MFFTESPLIRIYFYQMISSVNAWHGEWQSVSAAFSVLSPSIWNDPGRDEVAPGSSSPFSVMLFMVSPVCFKWLLINTKNTVSTGLQKIRFRASVAMIKIPRDYWGGGWGTGTLTVLSLVPEECVPSLYVFCFVTFSSVSFHTTGKSSNVPGVHNPSQGHC